ncbi:hypothetical protein SAMN06296429_10838 [Janibacter indicus]|uniref:Uncharacterized protein n=1 Tax=Janibacter indicus TaxID=857417 RepID=A0A1W2BGN7_9MICO|nr:hypothetical protein SAMN06296429_10838 [Janibacter indicus]
MNGAVWDFRIVFAYKGASTSNRLVFILRGA